MLKNSTRSTIAWLFRSIGICCLCVATLLSIAQFAETRVYALEEEPDPISVADCTNAATCVNGEYGSEICGKYACNGNQTNCSCQPDTKAKQCVCRPTV